MPKANISVSVLRELTYRTDNELGRSVSLSNLQLVNLFHSILVLKLT